MSVKNPDKIVHMSLACYARTLESVVVDGHHQLNGSYVFRAVPLASICLGGGPYFLSVL